MTETNFLLQKKLGIFFRDFHAIRKLLLQNMHGVSAFCGPDNQALMRPIGEEQLLTQPPIRNLRILYFDRSWN